MTSWRSVLKIHPAAELFPLMGTEELKALGEDIKKNGLQEPVITCGGGKGDGKEVLLDGRNRLDAMELVGMEIVMDGEQLSPPANGRYLWNVDPYAYVISANIHRRHLTTAQKGEILAALIKANPERSDRAIAKIAKVSDKTVGTVRKKLEATAEIPQLEKRVGADGKARAAPTEKAKPRGSIADGFGPPSDEAMAKLNELVRERQKERDAQGSQSRPALRSRNDQNLQLIELDASSATAPVPEDLHNLTVEPSPPLDRYAIAEAAFGALTFEEQYMVMLRWISRRLTTEQLIFVVHDLNENILSPILGALKEQKPE